MVHRYLIALGSNQRHHRHGRPEQILPAALREMAALGIETERAGPVVRSAPIGPSLRRYANSAAVVRCPWLPPALLQRLKALEQQFGRRQRGQRWTSRVLDLDIVLWDGGSWHDRALTVPHVLFRERDFVLNPSCKIAANWRDPVSLRTLRQLTARHFHPRRITED